MSYQRQQAEEEARRGVSLSMTNAVFSKLIKMGRELGKTPGRMAQELFEEAYAARCLGKPKLAAGDAEADLRRLYDLANGRAVELKAKLDEAEREHADLGRQNRELAGDRDVAKAAAEDLRGQLTRMEARYEEQFAGRERALDDVVKAQDLLIVARRERDELSRKCWNAETERDRLKAELAEIRARPTPPAAEPPGLKPGDVIYEGDPRYLRAVEQVNAMRDDGKSAPHLPVRTIRAMAAARNSPAAIARELGLELAQVKAALA